MVQGQVGLNFSVRSKYRAHPSNMAAEHVDCLWIY